MCKDCFGWKSQSECKVLTEVVCNSGLCRFYKTPEQFKEDAEKANQTYIEKAGK
jgi:hypothetical protein